MLKLHRANRTNIPGAAFYFDADSVSEIEGSRISMSPCRIHMKNGNMYDLFEEQEKVVKMVIEARKPQVAAKIAPRDRKKVGENA